MRQVDNGLVRFDSLGNLDIGKTSTGSAGDSTLAQEPRHLWT